MYTPKLNGLICLVVEPETPAAQILAAKLLNGGFSASHVHSCRVALELLKNPEETFDAILVNASKITTEIAEFPSRVKAALTGRPVPPILSYSYIRDAGQLSSLLRMGFTDCFTRPIQPDALWEKIDTAIHPELGHRSRVFAADISEDCVVSTEVELCSINEVGVEILSKVAFEIGTIVRVDSPSLRECGVQAVDCRVASLSELSERHDDKVFKVVTKFISLATDQRQSLRLKAQAVERSKRTSKSDGK